MATTVKVHGSAGRSPTLVEKVREKKVLSLADSSRSRLPICVSHSLEITNMFSV